MLNLAEVRALYPEYNDMTDYELTSAMHKTHYADMPFENFAGAFGGPAEEDKAEIAARQYNVLNPGHSITADDIRAKDRSGLFGGARLLMEGIYDAVTDTLPDNVARIWRGGDIGPDKRGWADDVIERQRKDQYARIPSIQEVEGDTLAKSLYEGPQSVATSMATGIAGAVLGAKTGAAIGTAVNPGAGTVAGGLIGSVAGSAALTLPAFYRLAKDQFVEEVQALHERKTGARLSAEQAAALNEAIDKDASEFGLWEAGPEAVAQAITSGLLFGAGGAFLKSIGLGGLGQAIGKRAITRIPAKLGVDVASEEVTEGATYFGQEDLRKAYGLRDTDPSVGEFMKEQAGPVAVGSILQMGLMGGGKMAHDRIMRRFAEKQDNVEWEEENAASGKIATESEPVPFQDKLDNFGWTGEGGAYNGPMGSASDARPVEPWVAPDPDATGRQAVAAHELATEFVQSSMGKNMAARGMKPADIYDFAREKLDNGQTPKEIIRQGQQWLTISSLHPDQLQYYRQQGFTDEQIADFPSDILQGAGAPWGLATPLEQQRQDAEREYYRSQGFTDEEINEFLGTSSPASLQAALAPQPATPQAMPQMAPQTPRPVQQKPDGPLAGYDPWLVKYYRDQGFSDEEIAEFLPNASQGQQTAAQINAGQAVDLLAPQQEQPGGVAGAVMPQQSSSEFDELAKQWAAELEAEGIGLPANNVQPAGGVADAVVQQGPEQQLQPQPIAQPAPMPTQSQITNTQAAPRADTLAAAQNLGLPAPEALPQQAATPEAGRPIPLGPALQDTRNLNPIAIGSTPIVQNQGENAPNTPQQPVTPQESQSTNDVRETEATETPKPKEPENPQDFLRNHVIVASSPFYGSSAEGTTKEQTPAQEKGQDKAERKSHGVIPTKAGEMEVYTEGGHVFVGDRRMTPDEAKEIINKAERKYGWNAVADQTGPVKKAIKSIEDDERGTFRGELAEYIDGEIAAGRRLNQNDVFKRANEILNTQKPSSITGNDAKAHSRQMIHDLLMRAMKRETEKGGDNLEQRLHDILNLAPSVITADRMKSLKASVINCLNHAQEQREKESVAEGQSDAASATTSAPINWENTINEDRITELSQSELNMINNMFNKKEAAPAEEAPANQTTQDNADTGEKPLEQWSRGALLAELGGGKEHRKASKPELVKAVRELRQKRERKPLGKNKDGETVYIDGYGARHLDLKNYISSQPAPEKGQNWDDADGLYNRGEEGRRFLTAEELAERESGTETNQISEATDNATKWDGKENPQEFLTREIGPFVADAYERNDLSLQDTISEAEKIIDRNELPISPQEVAGIAESAIYGEIYDRVMAEAKKGGANLRNRLDSIYNRHPNGMDARKLNSLRKFIDSLEDSGQQNSSNAGNMAVESGQGQERENGDSGQTGIGTGNTQGDRVGVSPRDGSNRRESVSEEHNTNASGTLDGNLSATDAGEAGGGNSRNGVEIGRGDTRARGEKGNSEQSGQTEGMADAAPGEESTKLAEGQGHVEGHSVRGGRKPKRDMGGSAGNIRERGIVSGLGGQESEVKEGAKNYHAPLGALERKGSWKETAARNLDIIELSKRLEAENREATPEEQALLAQYTGWGPSEIRNNLFRAGYGSTRREINPYAAPQDWRPLAERAKELLTQEEVETAFQSTQYAHYTSETMIRSIWKALEQLGFKGGKILEPGMGTGLFAVAAPADIMNKSRYTGVEMDKSTARIARYILPESDIINADFTKKKLPNDFFDLAIGNPPFADIKILNDPTYKKYRFTLHDYFFAKGLDKVRPGGLLVFVTSKGTMDKQNDKARSFMANRADLIGAIRLPQTAFKQNAGTEVVTDVLLLRKREKDEQPAGESWQGLKEVNTPEGETLINEYFANHPEMVLGRHSLQGSMYSANEYTVLPLDGNIDDHFAQAVERLPRDIYKPAQQTRSNEQKTIERDFDPKQKKEGAVYVDDNGILRRVEDGSGVALTEIKKLSPNSLEWVKDYIGVKEALKQAQYDQLNDGEWEKSLKGLNDIYDAFVKKHGFINDYDETEATVVNEDGEQEAKVTRRFKHAQKLNLDIESPLVNQLEKIDKEGKIVKGPFMLGRTIQKPKVPEIHNTNDALMVSLDTRGILDIDHVSVLAKKPREEVIRDLGELIYEAPGAGWQMADEYLSGDVVGKLEEAETAARNDKRFERNVKALEKVQPKRLEAKNITVSLGATWIPTTYLDQFAKEKLGIYLPGNITYNKDAGTYFVPGSDSRSNRRSSSEYGTPRRSPHEILSSILNNQSIKITDTDQETKKTYTDQEGTAQANEKAKLMREAFESWIWQDGERARYLVDMYNRSFNNIAPRRFDGSHLTLPGLSLRYKLYPHQKRAIWRVIQTGNVYLAHAVGAGKTLEMIVSGMEQRRLGLINRPMYVVPNHMLNQFASEFLEAYPLAQILVSDEKNFDKKNRRRFIAQATLNNPDAIIITHSGFGKLGIKQETAKAAMQGFIDQLEAAIEDSSDRYSRSKLEKRLEQAKRKIEARFEKDKDDMLFFEETGVDFLFVDEAHEFRKLDFVTNRNNVKGITPEGSQKALDLYSKLQWLEERHPGRSHVLASGTPVTNTMGELYSLLRYMDPASLEKDGLTTFDAWATMYGQVSAALEQNAAGTYETVERFSKFVNVPELMKRVRSFMDVLTMSQLGDLVKRPDLNGGVPANVVAKPSEALNEYLKGKLAARIERSRQWKPSRAQPHNPDPMINIITDGRLAAIDLRFVNPEAKNDPDSKLNLMIDDIIKTHKEIANRAYKDEETGKTDPIKGGTQIVFSSVGFGEQVSKNRGFDLRYHMMKRFKDAGIPASQVAWMSDYGTHAKKEAMFNDMRAGKVRILIGSPKNMGTGVNVQKRLCKLHFLSAPWYPADVEQPHGRILRQGNQNPTVDINWYATKGTYDSTAWGMVARKARFIEQAFTGDDTVRVLDDISESSQYEMAAALAAGDERAIQLAGYNADIERLSRLQRAHSEEQYSFRSRYRTTQRTLEDLGRDKKLLEEAITLRGSERISSDNFSATIAGKQYSKLKEAGEAILKRITELSGEWKPTAFGAKKTVSLGSIHNNECKLVAQLESSQRDEHNNLKIRVRSYTLKIGQAEFLLPEDMDEETSAQGLATRLVNKLNSLEKLLADNQQAEKNLREESRKLENRIGVPFPNEAELNEKIAEAARLREELEAEGKKAAQEQSNEDSENGESMASIRPGEYLASRNGNARGITEKQAKQVADSLNARAKNAAGVEVAQTFWDLPLNLQNKFSANVNTLEGVYDPNTGKVWLVADNLESTARAAEVWAHEQIVHNGLRGMLTESERRNVLNQLWLGMDGMGNSLIKRIAEAYGLNPRDNLADRLLVMEETLANLAERRQAGLLTPQQESMWRKIVRAIARIWNAVIEKVTGRNAGMGMEQVDNLLAALGGYVMDGMPANGQLAGEAAASLSGKSGETNSYGVPMERVTVVEGNITPEELNIALEQLAGQDLENVLEGLTAQVNRNQRGKLTSARARAKSMNNQFVPNYHNSTVARIANLWKWAAEAEGLAGSKNIQEDVNIRRFFSALKIGNKDAFAELTVKDSDAGLRIYSAELLNEKQLRVKLGNADETSSTSPRRSFEDILSRLSGPVKSQESAPLAALNLRQILNMGSKQAVNVAQAPEFKDFFHEGDLTLMQGILQLPHWLAKQQPKFAQIYERQIRRKDERAEAVTKSLREVPSLFGKDHLGKTDMESLKKLIWEIEGKKFDFEKTTKKFEADGEFANGRKKLKVNPQFYDGYVKALAGLQATDAAKKAMLEIRKSLDNDLCLAYNRMASMGEVTDDAITQFRDRINHIANYFPHHRYGRYFVQAHKDGEVVFRQHFDAINIASDPTPKNYAIEKLRNLA